MSNPFITQIKLDLNTGDKEEVNSSGIDTAHQYFTSLDILNRSAHIYGVVYLASVPALKELQRRSTT